MNNKDEILIKLKENSDTNILKKLKLIKDSGSILTSVDQEDKLIDSNFNFLCVEHGIFTLTGLDIKMNKHCPDCDKYSLQQKIKNIMSLDLQKRVEKLNEYIPLDYSEVTFKEIDSTIRPYCETHGQFITTPRKLLEGDKCKWCDGIEYINGMMDYRLDRDGRLSEKIRILSDGKYQFVNGTFKKYRNHFALKDIQNDTIHSAEYNKWKGPLYSEFINKVKNPEHHNSIFFKLTVTDTSTKFKFSLVHIIYLSEHHLKLYNDYIDANTGDSLIAQDIFTNKIIDEWFNAVFFNGDTKRKDFSYNIEFYKWSEKQRIYSLILQYINNNHDKKLKLLDELYNRIYHKLDSIGINTFWYEHIQETTSRSIVYFRESQLKIEKTCPICKRPIKDAVVDHEHRKKVKGSGQVRDNICNMCNTFISRTENNCKRHKIDQESLPEVLKNISAYFSSQQYPLIHYTDKDKRPRLSKTDANKVLKYWVLLYPKKKLPKIPKSGILTKDWEIYLNDLNVYLNDPYPIFPKKLWTQLKNLIDVPEYPKIHKVITPEWRKLLESQNLI